MAGTDEAKKLNDDLKNMLMAFRVSELQTLLGFAGRNKTGRKNELQLRAVELLRLKSVPIQMKIRELYKYIHIQQGVAQGPQVGDRGAPSTQAAMLSQQQMSHSDYSFQYQSQQDRAPVYPGYYDSKNTPPLTDPQVPTVQEIMPNNIPVYPDVKLKRLPFYDHMSDLLQTSTLLSKGTARIQDKTFMFHLTPAQANEIAFNRDLGTSNSDYVVQDISEDSSAYSSFKNEADGDNGYLRTEGGQVEVQMRFCRLETSCEQDDFFPPGIIVRVNEKPCPLPAPIPTNKQGVEPKRPGRPVNITSMIRISPTVANLIHVSWAAEFGREYVISVNLVKKLTPAQMLQRLKTKGVRHADYTTALIKEKLREDADSEIATTSLRVSLMCPLGKMRMSVPCRPTTCIHLQCFDASLYLQMNEKKPTWTCPVCDKPGLFDNLVIDGYFQEVLSSNKLPPDGNEIQLHQDGTWSISVNKKEENIDSELSVKHRGGPPVLEATVEIIDDDVVSVNGESESEEKKSDQKGKGKPLSVGANTTTVDLTLSDDDDDDIGRCFWQVSPVEGSSNNKVISKTATPAYSPNIIMLDSPSPPSSPGSLNINLPLITYPPPTTLPSFFDMDSSAT